MCLAGNFPANFSQTTQPIGQGGADRRACRLGRQTNTLSCFFHISPSAFENFFFLFYTTEDTHKEIRHHLLACSIRFPFGWCFWMSIFPRRFITYLFGKPDNRLILTNINAASLVLLCNEANGFMTCLGAGCRTVGMAGAGLWRWRVPDYGDGGCRTVGMAGAWLWGWMSCLMFCHCLCVILMDFGWASFGLMKVSWLCPVFFVWINYLPRATHSHRTRLCRVPTYNYQFWLKPY